MYLRYLKIRNHPILKDIDFDFVNPKTNQPYPIIAFVGENGCGKTTLLNEIFDYAKSEYVFEREKPVMFSSVPHSSLFLRQNSLEKNAKKEIGKRIDGKDRYEVNSLNPFIFGLKTLNPLMEKEQGLRLLETLDDVEIYKLFKEGVIDQVACGAEISQLIDGKKPGYDISNYSSGQQEILLKLKDLNEFYSGTDCVLLDEPETSLHPRWQLEIVNLIRKLLTDVNDDIPQIFLATHSEKVLQSLIGNDDALIIRLFKEKGSIKQESISEMDLRLPHPTFAELDYVIFKIKSCEYCSELFDFLEWKTEKSPSTIDRLIEKSPFYNPEIHYKEWKNEKIGQITSHTLPTYCRNYFHHPKDRERPDENQIKEAIELLRNVIPNISWK